MKEFSYDNFLKGFEYLLGAFYIPKETVEEIKDFVIKYNVHVISVISNYILIKYIEVHSFTKKSKLTPETVEWYLRDSYISK